MVIGESSFPSVGNDALYAYLRGQAVFHELTYEDIVRAADSYQLSEAQFDTLLADYRRQQEELEAMSEEWPDREDIAQLQHEIVSAILGMDPGIALLNDDREYNTRPRCSMTSGLKSAVSRRRITGILATRNTRR